MSETLNLPQTHDRASIYTALIPQVEALISGESDLVANQANIVAALKEAFGFFWVGFYWVKENQLVLGPFQGPIACTRIAFNRGVCGHAYSTAKSILVPNVDEFPGHIACSSASKSEVVIPIFDLLTQKVIGVLDVDSDQLNDFSETDVSQLETLMRIFEKTL
jgi:GAF domain-containing protein